MEDIKEGDKVLLIEIPIGTNTYYKKNEEGIIIRTQVENHIEKGYYVRTISGCWFAYRKNIKSLEPEIFI